jgi:opacity protein-like surface antigen
MAMTAAPLFAQQTAPALLAPSSNTEQPSRGYFTGAAGFTFFKNIDNFSTPGEQGTPTVAIEAGVRIVPHLMVFGEGGWIDNLQSAVQPTLVNTTTSLFAGHNYVVTGTGSTRVWYGLGGLRIAGPAWGKVTLYALGGAGVARLNPVTHFTYTSGTLTGVTTPAAGTDVTASLTSAGYFKAPLTSSALMLTAGGGLQLAVGSQGVLDARYRYQRIAADSTLSPGALGANTLSIGFGVRF